MYVHLYEEADRVRCVILYFYFHVCAYEEVDRITLDIQKKRNIEQEKGEEDIVPEERNDLERSEISSAFYQSIMQVVRVRSGLLFLETAQMWRP
ncbi:hypothetical protein MKW98_007076 [Papaver atlanticum]|uniref:Uncharacterized protein n=1 Tax=Papaver atlanticum TaxID=357466 RepID=A0AAD4STF0_9MAGN|nr:hypothetical protein MKW98_007076 [Papaver atlanticum]